MPELPEVEVVRRGLTPHLVGRKIVAISCSGKKLRTEIPYHDMVKQLVDAQFTCLSRRAKYLIAELSNGRSLIIHLGMTGKLGIFSSSASPMDHDHVTWKLDNGVELRFNDTRRFGSIRLISPEQNKRRETTIFKNTGPEPFDAIFTGSYLKHRAADRRQPVKSFIMDSSIVAGIGNIYANESLFAARIRPTRPAGRISKKKFDELVVHIREVLLHAIICGGSTISDFIGASGEKGYFQINFSVYGRKDQACTSCGSHIKGVRLGGRASFYCPQCQK